jgi:hypothetical protein
MAMERSEYVSRITYPLVRLLLSGVFLAITHGVIEIKLDMARNMSRTVDLDIDIGADAVDYKCVPCLFAMMAY